VSVFSASVFAAAKSPHRKLSGTVADVVNAYKDGPFRPRGMIDDLHRMFDVDHARAGELGDLLVALRLQVAPHATQHIHPEEENREKRKKSR